MGNEFGNERLADKRLVYLSRQLPSPMLLAVAVEAWMRAIIWHVSQP